MKHTPMPSKQKYAYCNYRNGINLIIRKLQRNNNTLMESDYRKKIKGEEKLSAVVSERDKMRKEELV